MLTVVAVVVGWRNCSDGGWRWHRAAMRLPRRSVAAVMEAAGRWREVIWVACGGKRPAGRAVGRGREAGL